ncbi:MAG TPA: DUF885 family protein, partial [Verrucomicrobiae bacterium]|nr:DUF885 family protein [Verrucomicrobiae bacterium]
MRRIASAVALGGIIIVLTGSANAAPPAASGDVASFRAAAHAYYEWSIEDQPTYASDQGLHTWDARLTDYKPAALAAREAKARVALASVAALDAKSAGWGAQDQIALALFRSDLEAAIFAAEVLRAHRRDPGLYVNECSNAIFSLIKKEYAPKAERARSATTRLKAMPALL